MDFYQIRERPGKNHTIVYPNFRVCRSKDLMVRGKAFYAIWDEQKGLWSTDEYDVARLVDQDLYEYVHEKEKYGGEYVPLTLTDFSSKSWTDWKLFVKSLSDSNVQLDEKLTFSNTEVTKKDYVSKRLPYPLASGPIPCYEELIGTLYDPDERAKIEWAIGAVVAGDARNIQKFLVFYGEAGSGKSTILNIIQKLFEGYHTTFNAKALTGGNNAFSMEVFRTNPLVAIQHDGDLSRIEDNSKLNSIISHEEMEMNEKYKPSYSHKTNTFLFMATNRPVKITDAKSGIIRRLIDVRPSGRKVDQQRYFQIMTQLDFELGGIAHHCLEVYQSLGKNYYSSYRPLDMMMQTDVFFNFVESNYFTFKEQDGCTMTQAYEMYKAYCDETLVEFKLPRHKFREELKNYFKDFFAITRVGPEQKQARSVYVGFLADKFSPIQSTPDETLPSNFVLDETDSIFDKDCADCIAQYASSHETPKTKWEEVRTTLSDIDTSKLHYVKPPENHIVIDFDLKNSQGEKSRDENLAAIATWPITYAEFSKGGEGIHLHYIYDGDVTKLSPIYAEGIEIKVFTGLSSLRRKLSLCNNVPVATINTGLPLKGDKVVNADAIKSERGLRALIERNLRKEIHPSTKPSVDFIFKILDDAYKQGLHYDLTSMRPAILAFANSSTNQSAYCVDLVSKMKFKSEEASDEVLEYPTNDIVFFDVEVFPNLFVICWKKRGLGNKKMYLINPTPAEIEPLLKMMLVGFNCRRYDNHIVYAAYIGFSNYELFELSQKIIAGSRNCFFGEAYNLSYTDILDFSSKKQSLKQFEIDLGIHHMELGLPWDQPVDPSLWQKVANYCGNDVDATEATFEDRQGDWMARLILADLAGMKPNDTTQQLMAKIIFGDDPHPQEKFIYTELSEMFEGYTFDYGKSQYRGEDPKEGGYVYENVGVWGNVALLDVESMHPRSIIELNMFGPYTKNFEDIVDARLAIKHEDFASAKEMLSGKLVKYLDEVTEAEKLSYALKIGINIVYGLTMARFASKFKDPRNKDNIVAKRGALFMIDLKHAVQDMGFVVAHIKTDSIKIPDATPEIIQFVCDFGKQYGYTFEHEATMDKFALTNKASYLCKYSWHSKPRKIGQWDATGKPYIIPYIFKTLCTHQEILFEDMCEARSVKTALYLNMNENKDADDLHFVGKVGLFCPMKPGTGGGLLLREKDGDYHAAANSKGFRWMEAEMVKTLQKEADIDRSYFDSQVQEVRDEIWQYADIDWFFSDIPYDKDDNGILPF